MLFCFLYTGYLFLLLRRIVSTGICLTGAYAFTRYRSTGLSIAYGAIVGSALIPGIVTARPLYDLFEQFGLVDTFPAITTIPRETSYSMPWDLICIVGWAILLPIIIFILIFEEQIMEGIMAGGVKQ